MGSLMHNKEVVTDIVLIDIINFSLLDPEKQLQIIEFTTRSYQKILKKTLESAQIELHEFILGYIPTGDGFYCLLQPRFKGFGVILGLSFHHLSEEISKKFSYFHGIRIAVHTGSLYEFTDILNNKNFIGSGLNDCARYLSNSEFSISTVMVSQSAYDNLKSFLQTHPQYDNILNQRDFKHSQAYTFYDKHGNEKRGYRVWLRKSGIITPPSREKQQF